MQIFRVENLILEVIYLQVADTIHTHDTGQFLHFPSKVSEVLQNCLDVKQKERLFAMMYANVVLAGASVVYICVSQL